MSDITCDDPVTDITGIGAQTADLYESNDVTTVGELLASDQPLYISDRHQDRAQLDLLAPSVTPELFGVDTHADALVHQFARAVDVVAYLPDENGVRFDVDNWLDSEDVVLSTPGIAFALTRQPTLPDREPFSPVEDCVLSQDEVSAAKAAYAETAALEDRARTTIPVRGDEMAVEVFAEETIQGPTVRAKAGNGETVDTVVQQKYVDAVETLLDKAVDDERVEVVFGKNAPVRIRDTEVGVTFGIAPVDISERPIPPMVAE